MNPNIPYGQQMPMQPPQRRHDNPYGQIPPHMRTHPGYPHYYPQPMGPMMPQYPQHYPQAWYPSYQHHMTPHHAARHQYYSMPIPTQQMPQPHGPVMTAPRLPSSPNHVYVPPAYPPPHPTKTPSSTSVTQIRDQSPPSTSSNSFSEVRKEDNLPTAPAPAAQEVLQAPPTEALTPQQPFFPPLPWLSVQDQPFPPRASRKRKHAVRPSLRTMPVTFPLTQEAPEAMPEAETANETSELHAQIEATALTPTQTSTPLPSDAYSDNASTQPTTPSSSIAASQIKTQTTPTQTKIARAPIPVVPVVPILTQIPTANRSHRGSTVSSTSKTEERVQISDKISSSASERVEPQVEIEAEKPAASAPPPPSSWAALLRNKNATNASLAGASPVQIGNGIGATKSEILGDVLNEIDVNENPSKLSFLQPRGLVNTGNMCYMNSVLQMLVFCTPFYEFLDRVANRAPHTFKSETPLIDAMILFMREFPIIDTTSSVDQLRLRLKPEDYERYGDSFIPEYVYNVIKQLPRFRDMRRGHQQDAQEFLGFLLEELHEECAHAMRAGTSASSGRSTPVGNISNISESADNETGWMEVGHKQKAAVTRSSGAITTESPVTSIFGGKLRSELKVAGNKLSVTLEPYQPLQLDIGSLQINNIVDALKGLTRPESMQGDFQSVRGPKTSATKQVFIETLPPVLVLHLKRFHYDSTTQRVEKIWKRVGYPLELEMPKEVFPTSARNKFAAHGGLPKYRLVGVIYHHGKNASGGHYTVDIRRQDGREWIRVDDTLIRRVRSEDVAEGGSEEDPKVLAAALERHKQGKAAGNRFEQIDDEDETTGSDRVWSQVNGHSRSKSTLSAIVNGSSTPGTDSPGLQTPRDRFSVKDNKVAYLLFYQRIST